MDRYFGGRLDEPPRIGPLLVLWSIFSQSFPTKSFSNVVQAFSLHSRGFVEGRHSSKCDQIDLDRLGSKLMKSYMENIYVQPHDECPNDQKILI